MSNSSTDSGNQEARLSQIAEQNSSDLSRANLLRMRSDYRGAIDQCLSLLKRSPEDPDAHTLIGDIYAEQGDLGQAAQWYELALDLNPESTQDQQKLNYVRQRNKEREAANAAQQIAVPAGSPYGWLPWAVMGVVAVIIGFGAYLAGQNQEVKKPGRANIPITAPITNTVPAPSGEVSGAVTDSNLAEEDRRLTASLSGQVPAGVFLLTAWQDPRNRDVTATVRVRPDDSERVIAAEVARSILRQMAGANAVTIRSEKNGQISYVGTVDRARLATTEVAGWAESNTGGEVLADALLAQEWPERTQTAPPQVPAGDSTPPGSSAGSDANTTGTSTGASTGGP